MNPILDACLRSWPWDPWLLIGLALTGFLYGRGWRILRRRDPKRWTLGHLSAFLGGLFALFLALASPIEPFSFFFLQAHMLQHLLLMMAAPPLVWLGAPMFPLLRGLPAPIRTYWVAPILRSRVVHRVFTFLTFPPHALGIYIIATWMWHVPALYDLALRSDGWHYVQHLCFLGLALIFWYPVVRPYPSRPTWSVWWLVPYLLLADVQNTILSALLSFSSRVLYGHYLSVPRLGNLSALDDQAAAGVLMWVPGSVAFLVPLFWIGLRLLFGSQSAVPVRPANPGGRIALTVLPATPPRGDLLRVPLIGRFLNWRHARLAVQLPVLALAAVVLVDGFLGPPSGPMNLAGVVPWIHWRGLVILGLLVLGNLFCFACPFLVPRMLARRFFPATRSWPRWLRSKWLAVGLLVGFLWAYEVLSLWDSPWLTAWIVVAYFTAAFVVDSLFRGASFCKYVCPIGQFNFVQSLMSPLEVKVRDLAVCVTCQTKDCIRGRDGISGCELNLYQPRKASSMDCTFCLDCVHACPHDNIGILTVVPGAELWRDPQRSGLGRFSRRYDVAAMVMVLVFGAFVNAAMMTGPVVMFRDRLAVVARLMPIVATTIVLGFGLIAAPLVLIGIAAEVSRRAGGLSMTWARTAARFSYAFVPLGFGMWLTHYSFHFLTSYLSILPTTQRFAADFGLDLGTPEWSCACCVPAADWLLRLEILFLDLGLLASLYVGFRIAQTQTSRWPRTLGALTPWALLMVGLFLLGVWIVFQPMEMRGTLSMMG